MDRREEIVSLQQQIIRELNRSMRQVGEDLWSMNKDLAADRKNIPSDDPFAGFEVPPVFGRPGSGRAPVIGEKDGEPVKPSADETAEPQTEKAGEKAEEKTEEEKPETIEELKAELNGYIGLDVIKEQVESLINWININKKRKEMDLPTPDLSLHMVFSGNPGTGKTMIARLMSRIFKCLGLLSKGHLIEVDRSGLVAGFVGQTAIKTKEVCDKAKGGVLFIDEAYSLTDRGGNDYGQEAVDTVLKAMEDNRDDLVVIVAGYIEPMEKFIHSNPGLESRFNRFMDFPDYTVDEMVGIFNMRCSQGGYSVDEDAAIVLRDIISEKSKDVKGFGNARGVRNLFELAIAEQADRLAALPEDTELTRELLMTIIDDDLINAAQKK